MCSAVILVTAGLTLYIYLHVLPVQSSATVPSKEDIVRQLTSFIDREMTTWLEGKDLRELCATNHKQLLELKVTMI